VILIQYVELFTVFANLTMTSTFSSLFTDELLHFCFFLTQNQVANLFDQLSIVLRLGIELLSHNFQNTAMSSGQAKRLKNHGLWCRIYL